MLDNFDPRSSGKKMIVADTVKTYKPKLELNCEWKNKSFAA